ncbi:hypothetical protein [Glutamicibacter sp. NPDC127525]
MKKFMKQFEGLVLTSRGEWGFVLIVGVVFFGSLVGTDYLARVA